MAESWTRALERWVAAGLVAPDAAASIRTFEQNRGRGSGLSRPIWLALALGGLMLGAGVLLFVSAHWDALSPAGRLAIVGGTVVIFHLAAAGVAGRFHALASALHGVGTVALGAGIFLTGQIFNMNEHWPAGLLLWTIGAAVAWALLDDWPQMAILALVGPAWLCGEWFVAATPISPAQSRVAIAGLFLLAVVAFTAANEHRATTRRRVLVWMGGLALPIMAINLALLESATVPPSVDWGTMSTRLAVIGWSVAIGLPLIVGALLHGTGAWKIAAAVAWVIVLFNLRAHTTALVVYVWWALGAIALIVWGVHEKRSSRVNLGSVAFAGTVLTFYFSQVMDKLGRSASLVGLGVLFLAGGWALERLRRRLVLTTREKAS